jgi:ABC-type transport system involved in multi-copper enzyme maturation permease subunit
MMGRVSAMALNTFREAIRSKVLYGVLGVVVAFNAFAAVLGAMSLHEEARIARDVGLAGVSLFGSFTAMALGVSLLYTEIDKRTIHVILAKPIERHEFVLGKYLGMALTLSILVGIFALATIGMLFIQGVGLDSAIVKALLLGELEVLVVAAIAIFFSSFSTPFLSGIFTFSLFFLGRVSGDIQWAADRAKQGWIKPIAKAALYLVPDLHMFAISGGEVDGKPVSVHAAFVSWRYVGYSGLYAIAVIGALLVLAMTIFSRRDFA